MKRNVWLGSALVVVCAVVAFVAMGNSVVTKVAFADLPRATGRPCEVYGKLDAASIHSIHGANVVSFQLVEEKSGDRLNVLYDNQTSALPANFPAASHARVSGVWEDTQKKFIGNAVTTKCPSKYQQDNPELAARKPFIEKWQQETGLRADAN